MPTNPIAKDKRRVCFQISQKEFTKLGKISFYLGISRSKYIQTALANALEKDKLIYENNNDNKKL